MDERTNLGTAVTMGWILLESLVALLILVGIVAWTMAPWRRRRGALPPPDEPGRGPDRDPGP